MYIHVPVSVLGKDIPTLRIVCNEIRGKYNFPYSIAHTTGFERSAILVKSLFDDRPLCWTNPGLCVEKLQPKDKITRACKWINTRPTNTYDFTVVVADVVFLTALTKRKEVELFHYHVVDKRVARTTPFHSGCGRTTLSSLAVDGQLLELHDWLRYDHNLNITVRRVGDQWFSINVRRGDGPKLWTTLDTKNLVCHIENIEHNRRPLGLSKLGVGVLFNLPNINNCVDQVKAQVILLSNMPWRRVGNIYLIEGLLPELLHKIVYFSLFSHGLR